MSEFAPESAGARIVTMTAAIEHFVGTLCSLHMQLDASVQESETLLENMVKVVASMVGGPGSAQGTSLPSRPAQPLRGPGSPSMRSHD